MKLINNPIQTHSENRTETNRLTQQISTEITGILATISG